MDCAFVENTPVFFVFPMIGRDSLAGVYILATFLVSFPCPVVQNLVILPPPQNG